MAHHRRAKPRIRTFGHGGYWDHVRRKLEKKLKSGRRRQTRGFDRSWMDAWPAWHDVQYHTRPKRREIHALERAVLMDRVDADNTAWPLGNSKPHRYYW